MVVRNVFWDIRVWRTKLSLWWDRFPNLSVRTSAFGGPICPLFSDRLGNLSHDSRRNGGQRSAFTLIELLVVVVILGILVAVVVRNVQNRVPQARVAVVKTQIREFESALDEYKMDNGQYPTTEQGLQALVTKPTSGQIPSKYPEEGYMKRIPKDPWGNDYVYIFRPSAKNPIEIISFGRDGKEGGEGEDKDLINYEALAQ